MNAKILARIGIGIATAKSPINKTLAVLRFVALLCANALLAISQLEAGSSRPTRALPAEQAVKQLQADKVYGRIPLSFEANRGQANKSVDFLARGPGYTLLLEAGRASFRLKSAQSSAALQMRVAGTNAGAKAEEMEELAGKVNYFIGNDPAQWRRDIPTYGRVRYGQIYRGIDLVYYGNQRQLEYDFVVAPGADWRQISLAFDGAEKIEIEPVTGDLLLHVKGEIVRQAKPIVYQEEGGERRAIEGSYRIRRNKRVTFAIGEYDKSQPLVIDPVLLYSTFLGGSGVDGGNDIAVDSAGNAYVTGSTVSTNFPTANAFQGSFGGQAPTGGSGDAFVTKFNAAGSALVYSTYLGGDSNDGGSGIAVDSEGNAYVTGGTQSTNFPTANAFQAANGAGASDAFVTKLDAAGSALIYSTYLGGIDEDSASDIAIDPARSVYLAGVTVSNNFPTANAFQNMRGGDNQERFNDAFVTKFNAEGSALVYSTFLGGAALDRADGIAVDSGGNAYITGSTESTNFPTANALQGTKSGGREAFITKFNATGSALVYSTYLGGFGGEFGNAIEVNSAGEAYVTGSTDSTNFPTANALQGATGGSTDAFVTKLNSAGSAFIYSTYLGGSSFEIGYGVALDSAGNAHVAGVTNSTNFPTANAFQSANGAGGLGTDAFVAKFDAAGSAFVYSTYLGGSGSETCTAIALDSDGNAYVTGDTTSTNFPTAAALQSTINGSRDGFVAKIGEPPSNGVAEKTLGNISTRLPVLTGENVLIGGIIVVGQAPKKVIIRALGPSLGAAGVSGALQDPVLQLFQGDTLLVSNDNWKDDEPTEIANTGVAPGDDREAAIVRTLELGNYTAVVRGKGDTTGVAIVEGYDLEQRPDSKLGNISTRGFVSTGDNVLIGGFIVGPNTRVVARAIGPSLSAAGISGPLQDPTLDLVNAQGVIVRANDDWEQSQKPELEAIGIQPSDARESALVETLAAGNYTAVVRGKDGTTGVAVVEVYNLQ